MTAARSHRLDGLEPDNLLAFLALLGLLRALEAVDRARDAGEAKLMPRVAWDVEGAPLRPVVHLASARTREALAAEAAAGVEILAGDNRAAGDRLDLNHPRPDARDRLAAATKAASARDRGRVDVLAALMTDAAVKEDKDPAKAPIDPTPLCLLFGQGHQHFLDRFATVPATPAPPTRGRGKSAVTIDAATCLAEALFEPWHRADPTFSFRWDPDEDVRYAMMAGDPTDAAYKGGTQHGANRLAAIGIGALSVVPQSRRGRVRAAILGGDVDSEGTFSLAWPVWRAPARLAAIRALLSHSRLRHAGELDHLGVDHVLVAKRISVGKFMNFTPARPLT